MPIAIARLRALIDLARADGVEIIDIVEDGTRVRIERSGSEPLRRPSQAPQTTAMEVQDPDIFAAPMFGVLHLTSAPDAPPFAQVGDLVAKGQQIGLIEAMKMFTPVFCDRDGRIVALLVKSGSEVSRGQPMFRIVGS